MIEPTETERIPVSDSARTTGPAGKAELTNPRLLDAIAALRNGRMVIVRDDDHPEVGGYLCAHGAGVTTAMVNVMATDARGLICVALTEDKMRALGVPMLMPERPLERRHRFGASIEARRGVTTGISAADRACTIDTVARPDAGPDDIDMPGHVFPIQVSPGGVLFRAGIPEASVDLVRMADGTEVAALCAILDEDGDVADVAMLESLGQQNDWPIVTVGQLVAHRLASEVVVERLAERTIESRMGGVYRAVVYRNDFDGHEHLAMIAGELKGEDPVPVRIHSECLTGDVLGSTRCDCGDQLRLAMERISAEGRGVVVYMHQEGRGIGLGNKIRAYALQDQGRDTVEANLELGFAEDLRDYGITAQILKDLGIHRVSLLTNNPLKVAGLERYGVTVAERMSLQPDARGDNVAYLRTKKDKLGHLLDEDLLGSACDNGRGGGKG